MMKKVTVTITIDDPNRYFERVYEEDAPENGIQSEKTIIEMVEASLWQQDVYGGEISDIQVLQPELQRDRYECTGILHERHKEPIL